MTLCCARPALLLLSLLPSSLSAQTFTHACDGSAIAAAGGGYFFNATDEDNIIRLYSLAAPGKPVREFNLNAFLKPELNKKGEDKEVDFEGVTRLGDRLYWIGSHGRDRKKNREHSRQRLFATTLSGSGAAATITPAGVPYDGLLAALTAPATPVSAALRAAEPLAHEQGGLDIEGLAATSSGALLIGFRSPLVGGKALLARLTNPADVVAGKAPPQFGQPLLLDLQGLAVRDIIPGSRPDEFLILAGSSGAGGRSAVFSYVLNGRPEPLPLTLPKGPGSPEGLLLLGDRLYVSLDGGDEGSPACKDRPVPDRSFTIHKLR